MGEEREPEAKVIRFPGVTRLDLNPDLILQEAVGKLEGCVIVGFDKNGMDFFASSYADVGGVLYHLERGKWRLMHRVDDLGSETDPRDPGSAA